MKGARGLATKFLEELLKRVEDAEQLTEILNLLVRKEDKPNKDSLY